MVVDLLYLMLAYAWQFNQSWKLLVTYVYNLVLATYMQTPSIRSILQQAFIIHNQNVYMCCVKWNT